MRTNTPSTSVLRIIELTRRPIFITASVAGLAAVVGCSNMTGPGAGLRHTRSAYTSQLADRSGVTVDPSETVGQYDAGWYTQRAGEVDLPPLWLGEAVQATADVQAQRAGAIASRIARRASESAALADAQADLRSAMTDEEISLANADGAHGALEAKIARLTTTATTQESSYESQARLNDSLLDAMMQTRQAKFDAMRSQAVAEFEQAQAEHERMVGQRQAVSRDGQAEIAKMVKIADMTEARAASKVKALRTEANSTTAQTNAQLDDLDQQIQTLTAQIAAQSGAMREKASSLEKIAKATSSELLAKADAIDQRDADQQYELKIKTADLDLAQAQSAFDESAQLSDAKAQEATAALVRKRADAERFILTAEADHTQQLAAIKRFHEQGLADVFVMRANADRVERDARSEFVKAQAEALAQASREEATHLDELAKKQYEQAKAQAEADAANIRAQMIASLARQMQSGQVDLPGKSEPSPTAAAGPDDAAPAKPAVATTPAVVEPERVAKFKSALARATKIRAQADAREQTLGATFKERTQKLAAWWRQQSSEHTQMLAQADAFEKQSLAEAEAIRTTAQKNLRLAKANKQRATAEAEAFRNDAAARITSLRASAHKTKEQMTAQATRLLAQAEANDKGGAADLRALAAKRDAVAQRGEATSRELLAQADSIETGQRALVKQMRQEIASSGQILQAELARLDQSAKSFIQIAQATYDEATTLADTFAEKTRIASDNITISNEVDRKIAQAGVDHLRNVVNARELAGEAQIQRQIAQATAKRELAESDDVATRAGVLAQSQIVEALANAKLAGANATDEKVRSIFDSRIASVQAQRDQAYAQQWLSDAQRRARLDKAQAAADAYQGISSAALARLNEKKQAFETAAKANWDVRLAMPASGVTLDWPTLNPNFNTPGLGEPHTPGAVAEVQTDADEN